MKKKIKFKNKKIYVYIDVPVSKHQINQIFPKEFKLKKNLIFINTSNLNFENEKLKNFYKKIPKSEIPKNMIYIKNVNNLKIFFKKIKSSDIFIFYSYFFSLKNYNASELFNKINCKKILIKQHSWIFPNFKKDFFISSFRLIKYTINKIFFSENGNSIESDYILSFGEKNKKKFIHDNHNNYLDYPTFWIKFNSIPKNKKLVIYVDETLDYSGDHFLIKNKFSNKIRNINDYLKNLNHFFSMIEKKFNCKLIICCKKKFRYDKNYFDGRKLVYGKTLELISKSKLVIGHKSDALIQAIYSKSPVILLKSKEFAIRRNLEIHSKSINLFNKRCYFLEDYIDKKVKLDTSIDNKYYKKIINNYFISKNQIKQNFHEKLNSDLSKLLL